MTLSARRRGPLFPTPRALAAGTGLSPRAHAAAGLAAAGLAAILASLIAPHARAHAAPGARVGTLRLVSKPEAQAYLDGKYLGLTPLVRRGVTAGRHTVELRTGNGRVRTRTVQMPAGGQSTVNFHFPPPRKGSPGTLVVSSVPWSQVFLDGKSIGTTPIEGYRVAAHSYMLELRASNGQRLKRVVWVEAGQRYRVVHRFDAPGPTRIRGPSGWVRINTTPPSKVWIDGKVAGQTPVFDHVLSVGFHQVKLVTRDGRTHLKTLRIAKDQTTQLVYRFPPKAQPEDHPKMGFLRVAANVEARVYVDGKPVGWTPLMDAPVRAGRRHVTLRAGRQHRSYVLRFRAGFTRSISVRFVKRRR